MRKSSNKIYFKTPQDIAMMRRSALLLAKAHGEVAKHIKEGVATKVLDKIAYEYIRDHKATPSFLNYNGFPATLCMSINEVVVHGIPGTYQLRSGDIVSIDCGVFLDGYHADSAYTYPVGEISEPVKALLKATKESLYLGIKEVKKGNRTGDIGFVIQRYVEERGYGVVRELVGHGVGKNLHEGPDVPNYGRRRKGDKLKNGMVIAIEPMINLGKKDVVQEPDGWTIRTGDKMPSAHYEHTVALIDNKAEVLTSFKYIEEALHANKALVI